MARRRSTVWVAVVAPVALAACGTVAQEPPRFEANPPEPGQEAPTQDPEAAEPDERGGQHRDRGTDGDDPGDQSRGADPAQDGDDGETLWHLLPEDDRPGPVEQRACEPADPSAVAC